MKQAREVPAFLARLRALQAKAEAQAQELVPFVEGKRQSPHPIGSRFFLNMGAELQGLLYDVEQWSRLSAKR